MLKYPLKKLIAIVGPTASGKTQAAINVARHFNTEIISADSRQLYREFNIGVARPTPIELDAVRHHFIADHSILKPISVYEYEKLALDKIHRLFETKDKVVICGGTGLYISAIANGLDPMPSSDQNVLNELEKILEDKGVSALQNELTSKDPEYAESVDLGNHRRLIRALSVMRSTGKTFSSHLNQNKKKRDFLTQYFVLDRPRSELYDRINDRVDQMMLNGLLEEVVSLQPHFHLNILNTVGYQEFIPHLSGECSLEDAVEKVKQHSRNYAKRQLTWFRNQLEGHWVNADEASSEIIKLA